LNNSLAEVEHWLGQPLPEPYRGFLETQADDLPVGELVVLYGRASFQELNEAHQVKTYCPRCVTIGNDSGGREILLDLSTARIGRVDAGSMGPEDAYPLADDFAVWLASGCDLQDPPPLSGPDRIDIHLTRPPADGLKGLVRVLKLLDLTVPASEYRSILASVPCRLARDVDALRYGWRCAEYNLADPCLGAFVVDRPEPVPIAPRAPASGPPPGLNPPDTIR
jgi:hypothetical protein